MFGPCLTPYQRKAKVKYSPISLIHWRIIIQRSHPFKAVAQPFSLLHHQGPIPSNGVRRMSRPAHVLLLTISPSVTPPRILTPIFQPSWRISTGNFGCHFEPGSGGCFWVDVLAPQLNVGTLQIHNTTFFVFSLVVLRLSGGAMVCWPGDIFTRQVVEFPAPVSDSSQQIISIHESFTKYFISRWILVATAVWVKTDFFTFLNAHPD